MKNVHKRQEQKQAAIFGKPLHFSRAPKSFEERENQYRSTRRTLGEGYFAKVYEGVSKGEVIKVMAFNSVQHASRDPYLHYLAACSAFPDNPYLPKVYAVHLWECSEEGDVWAEIVMENLGKVRDKSIEYYEDKEYLKKVYTQGAVKARATARTMLADVYEKIGFVKNENLY